MITLTGLAEELHGEIRKIPVIDCHEHLTGPEARPPYKEPISALIPGYVFSDLQSASYGVPDRDLLRLTGSRLRTGARLTRGELLTLALMSSENRAAAALARTFPGGTGRWLSTTR